MTLYDDLVGACTAIETQCASYLNPKGVTTVFGYIGEGQVWPVVNDTIRPCAVIELPGVRRKRDGAGITGELNSMQELHFDVLCVGPTATSALKTFGLVCNALRGYKPISGGSEITLLGSALRSPAMQSQTPTRYAMPVGFSLSIGAIVVS